MPAVRFDLRGLAPSQSPSRRHVASVVDGADAVTVLGPVPALAAVLSRLWRGDRLPATPVAWLPADDPLSRRLAAELSPDDERELPLVRDDSGGVLLAEGRLAAAEGTRRWGAQAWCDDTRVCDGPVRSLVVRPAWGATDRLTVTVPRLLPRRTTGRALQVACEPAVVLRDGVPLDRPVQRWTWYADDRVRWRLVPPGALSP